ncbi:MAG TPA: GNAT family N-acetyltransferase [Marmoricola sp.]|jgi:RimJ/RimL family protein N-acetyltransferase|nr:GNAT family N-acetyltransferase [Marmoricola sp.]
MIATPRLRIRDWTIDDAPAVLDIHSRVEVVQWLGDGEPVLMKDLGEATERIGGWLMREDPPLGFWAIEVTEPGALQGRAIGAVLLVPLPGNENGEIEIGWHLHPDAWGHRYAAEAARAILQHGFEGGLEEIHAVTHLTNEPSMSVCRQIGMEHRGIVHTWYDEPSEYFVITRDQWSRGSSSRDLD